MIAPAGWHVPSKDEWQVLTDYLGGDAVAGGKMKTAGTVEAGTGLWNSPNAGATNESGFSALPGGRRGALGSFVGLGFNGMAFFWSVTQGDIGSARYWYLSPTGAGLFNSTTNQLTGFSVRCVKDPDNSGIESKGETPHAYALSQNYPNPFNARTMISYSLPVACRVKITVHTLNGQRVTTLVDGFAAAGTHSVAWAADNIASGFYFYRMQTEHVTLVRKLLLQK